MTDYLQSREGITGTLRDQKFGDPRRVPGSPVTFNRDDVVNGIADSGFDPKGTSHA